MKKIKDLKIGDKFSIRKNGTTYEYLGYCPIENVPSAYNHKSMEVVHFDDENKKIHIQ